jgi:hypothetical protein
LRFLRFLRTSWHAKKAVRLVRAKEQTGTLPVERIVLAHILRSLLWDRVERLLDKRDMALAGNLLEAFLTNKIVEATVTFRLFEGIGVVRGRGRAKLSEKRMHFVREKRDEPAGRRFHAECVSLSALFYRRCSSFAAKSFVS